MKIDMQAIVEILERDNTAEVKRNKDGDVLIIEIKKSIVKKLPGSRGKNKYQSVGM